MPRLPIGASAVAVLAWALAALGPVPARADIRARVAGGKVVFVSRPQRKPDAAPRAARSAAAARRKAPAGVRHLVRQISLRHGLDPLLVTTLIGVESGFDRMAVSPKGARGLMQLMPETARRYGVRDVHDPWQNIEAGVSYLGDLLERFGGDLRLAVAAYNAGPEAVLRARGVPDFPETKDYLRKIEARYGRTLASGHDRPSAWIAGRRSGGIRVTRSQDGTLMLTNRPGLVRSARPGRAAVSMTDPRTARRLRPARGTSRR